MNNLRQFFSNVFVNYTSSLSKSADGRIQTFLDSIIALDGIKCQKNLHCVLTKNLVLLNLLTTSNQKVTLSNGENITWVNVKNITIKEITENFGLFYLEFHDKFNIVELFRVIFWYYRKGIVDNILGVHVFESKNATGEKCFMSISGSTNLTSDYDITLDGNYSSFISKRFDSTINKLFSNTPAIVFDTNVYFTSFITSHITQNDPDFTSFTCMSKEYNVSKKDKVISGDQHVWSALKIFQVLVDYEEEGTFDDQTNFAFFYNFQYLSKSLCAKISISKTSIKLFGEFLTSKDDLKGRHRALMNCLSMINEKSDEAYYTRGAFLDVVLNQQLCKETVNYSLDYHDYLDSFIENVAFFYAHNQTSEKYKVRFMKAAKNLDKMVNVLFSEAVLFFLSCNKLLLFTWLLTIKILEDENVKYVTNLVDNLAIMTSKKSINRTISVANIKFIDSSIKKHGLSKSSSMYSLLPQLQLDSTSSLYKTHGSLEGFNLIADELNTVSESLIDCDCFL